MSEEEVRFLPYDEAKRLVAAIQEEEDVDEPDRRILSVYNHQDTVICWFDFEETLRDAGVSKNDESSKAQLTEYIMKHIPEWALEM